MAIKQKVAAMRQERDSAVERCQELEKRVTEMTERLEEQERENEQFSWKTGMLKASADDRSDEARALRAKVNEADDRTENAERRIAVLVSQLDAAEEKAEKWEQKPEVNDDKNKEREETLASFEDL